MNFPITWNLDSIYAGKSCSSYWQHCYQKVKRELEKLQSLLLEGAVEEGFLLSQKIGLDLKQMRSLVECLHADDSSSGEVASLTSSARSLSTQLATREGELEKKLSKLPEKVFSALLEKYPQESFHLLEKRGRGREKLPVEKEAFIDAFAVDGYHGWGEAWKARISELSFVLRGKSLSFGQIENQLSHINRSVRQESFALIQQEFTKSAPLFSQILNHLGGFRLEIYKQRGWDLLKEPLEGNRMKRKTLDAMWEAVEKMGKLFATYLKCKANLLGIDQMSWYDLEAPLPVASEKISYQSAGEALIRYLERFSPKMATFAHKALKNGWVDGQNRSTKPPGAFCITFPRSKESRIFLTFSNTSLNFLTLAHELGHAFHHDLLYPLSPLDQDAKMGVAEAASTMGELLATKGALKEAKTKEQRLFVLDNYLCRASAYLMNIRARFLFEKEFYQQRAAGFVPPEKISALMEKAQREGYSNALTTYHPLFWAAKLHSFLTDDPFYNFPYTFGYLFSLAIYQYAIRQNDFESTYISLLQDTGKMSVEDLAQKHLREDLSQTSFWEKSLQPIKESIDMYVALAQEVSR